MQVKAGALVGVGLTGENICGYGHATQPSTERLTLLMKTGASADAPFPQGQLIALTALAEGCISLLTGEVVSFEDRHLTLTLHTGGRTVFRRSSQRLSCSVPIEFRGGTVETLSPWQQATVNNMSMGGMSILFPAGVHVPKEIEVRFPSQKIGSDSRPISLFAQILRRRPLPNGKLECGVSYTKVVSSDLYHLFDNLFGPVAAAIEADNNPI